MEQQQLNFPYLPRHRRRCETDRLPMVVMRIIGPRHARGSACNWCGLHVCGC